MKQFFWFPLIDALAFLTVLPIPAAWTQPSSGKRMAQALMAFPLVGIVIGAAAAGICGLAYPLWPFPVAVGLGLIAWTVLTGGLHLDGWADAIDGLSIKRSSEESRRIMSDARIGAFGATGLILLLGLKWGLLVSLDPDHLLAVLVTVCALSRWGMVLSAQMFPYASGKQGMGRMVTDLSVPWAVGVASFIALGAALVFWRWEQVGLLVGLTLAVVGVSNSFFMMRLGGVTGDTLGAVNELVEVVLLMGLAAVW